MTILVTGAAGFIGFHTCKSLLKQQYKVIGLDNMNDYYSVQLKSDRLCILNKYKNFKFIGKDLIDFDNLYKVFSEFNIKYVIHLAAQAGVRYSLQNPKSYISSNLVGFANILECCRNFHIEHLIFASSSSVYGLNRSLPYSPHRCANHPVSLYAATKGSNELMAHAYSHLFEIPATGLRFFTVYGPWGRPDMALHLFTSAIVNENPINIFNEGKMRRDFTYIDDIVDAIIKILPLIPHVNKDWDAFKADPATSSAPWRIFNIGSDNPVKLLEFINILEDVIGKKAIKKFLPMQKGDVVSTWADLTDFDNIVHPIKRTSLREGIQNFWNWYKSYYKILM